METVSESAATRLRLWHPRFRICTVCRRPARGFGWFNPPHRPEATRRGLIPWTMTTRLTWFCSMACQGLWSCLAGEPLAMIDLTDQERGAIRASMKLVAEIMEEIGWQTRLVDLTEAQVLTLIEVAVGGFQDAMHATAKADTEEIPF